MVCMTLLVNVLYHKRNWSKLFGKEARTKNRIQITQCPAKQQDWESGADSGIASRTNDVTKI